MKQRSVAIAILGLVLAGPSAYGQATKSATKTPAAKTPAPRAPAKPAYKRKLPATLMKQAKISEPAAADIAKGAVPNATISEMALEKEGDKLIYSYDLKTAGKTGVDEVHVDAMTGAVVSNVHETPAQEKAEKAKDKKPAATPPKVKKP